MSAKDITQQEFDGQITPEQAVAMNQINDTLNEVRDLCNKNGINFFATAVCDNIAGTGAVAIQAIDVTVGTKSARVIAAAMMGSQESGGMFGDIAMDAMFDDMQSGRGNLAIDGQPVTAEEVFGKPEGQVAQ